MKKKYRTTINEVFYEVSMKASYREGIKQIRSKYDIPERGFKNEIEQKDWFKNILGDRIVEFVDDGVALNRKHKLSLMYYEHQEALLYYRKRTADFRNNNLICSSHVSNDAGVDRLHILVNPYASVESILDYINDNRKEIKEKLDGIRGGFKKKYSKREKRDRDERIYEIYQELLTQGHKGYKEFEIAKKILSEFGEEISFENIKNVVHEQRKLRK